MTSVTFAYQVGDEVRLTFSDRTGRICGFGTVERPFRYGADPAKGTQLLALVDIDTPVALEGLHTTTSVLAVDLDTIRPIEEFTP